MKKFEAKEITPNSYKCGVGACPSVFQTNRGTYVVIGKISNDVTIDEQISRKIGKDEFAVELPAEILDKLFKE